MFLPVAVLVGRPNVGKSTLFNRLTKSRQALVADFPGLTRDRQYLQASFQKKSYWVVDTGGIGVEDELIDDLMSKQSQQALLEADAIFFMVDARSGLMPLDQEIAARLRKLNKPVFLLVNKVDGLDEQHILQEFQSLGWRAIYLLSASHGLGIDHLLTDFMQQFQKESAPPELIDEKAGIPIAFIGRPNVGKSTLMNRLLGEDRVVVSDVPGTTRDSIMVPFKRGNTDYQLIDTAGVRRRGRVNEKIEKFSVIKTLQAIETAQVCLLLLDATEGVTEQDLHLMGLILESGKAFVIVVNKWDGLAEEQRLKINNELDRRLQFVKFAKICFISALRGTGLGPLFADIDEVYQAATQRISTTILTRLLASIIQQHPPPLVRGRRAKLRYAHVGGHHPLVIVVHGNQLDQLPESYTRYLMNQFRIELDLGGLPIHFEYKNTVNPYKDRKNKLTQRQVKSRKRMMRFVKK
ncbi:MAG: ribosome biogenesis GTPase Der [Gammaproteobacteria bacterium]|nr:ribosome biogenesis GTPase Der [Gammaproteobacteria bacterium]